MYNHLRKNYHITNKKGLFLNLKKFLGDKIFDCIPLTFHIDSNNLEEELINIK